MFEPLDTPDPPTPAECDHEVAVQTIEDHLAEACHPADYGPPAWSIDAAFGLLAASCRKREVALSRGHRDRLLHRLARAHAAASTHLSVLVDREVVARGFHGAAHLVLVWHGSADARAALADAFDYVSALQYFCRALVALERIEDRRETRGEVLVSKVAA